MEDEWCECGVELAVEVPTLRRGVEIWEADEIDEPLLMVDVPREERPMRAGMVLGLMARWRAATIQGSAMQRALAKSSEAHGKVNARRRAGSGLSRRSGSHVRHLEMKSTKDSSSDLSTWARVFEPGRLRRPFELTTGRGAPAESEQSRKLALTGR